ncbi:4a-hydroxytetrahydrobiopterin dehydratase [Pseudomaricurvus alkylphenolicus]|jgi:4a-hydroxytetrahydrobiopterin dehydratase|uniref:4a-hydroxytetrahydrobiopterin dehydratase n=1 Tax=Pseudomaricurvus alkylphenolicus TaxID=1306991 RepID=UPI0014245F21|nr:4a-hydroxytetrahydrobiopterin dehydratase [Pseudomaricurvus alkylphenolicus]NIB41916.1 4a-hydroxytetrahydrobiopterin dehydratase [Pseudomaricurvus alkylphenolicus]
MTALAGESCTACDANAPAVESDEQLELLEQLPGWAVISRKGVPQLEKIYPFRDFNQALDFANAVGELAEGANHHPALLVEWGKTTVTWWTHAIGGLHRNDFVMAAKTDYLHGK